MGTRWPQPNFSDFRRISEKTLEWVKPRGGPKSQLPEGLRVFNPVHWPSFGTLLERQINRAVLKWSLSDVLFADPFPEAVITTTPVVADLFGAHKHSRWIYYCVDNLAEWPGLRRKALYRLERDLLPKCDRVICVSEAIAERLQKMGYKSDIVTHGVDLAFWSSDGGSRSVESSRKPHDRPTALFWGTIDDRLDVKYCLSLLERFEVNFVGPVVSAPEVLRTHPYAEFSGAVAFDRLPGIAEASDILVIPYAIQDVTREMQPLKLKEYLATGMPVVASNLPAYAQWTDAMDIAVNPEEFLSLCLERAGKPLPREQGIARNRLKDEGWSAKAKLFSDLIFS